MTQLSKCFKARNSCWVEKKLNYLKVPFERGGLWWTEKPGHTLSNRNSCAAFSDYRIRYSDSCCLHCKCPDAGKDGRQGEKGTTDNEMVGWHHRLNGHESEQAPGDGEGQGSLACCSPWGRKESDTSEQLSNNNVVYLPILVEN